MTGSKQTCIPGIIGGLGPLSHIEFQRKLIEKNVQRGVLSDQEHPVWLLVNATDIPVRTQSLLAAAGSSTVKLTKYGELLHLLGADFLIVTCNSAHAFYEQVQAKLPIPWIHLMDVTSRFILQNYPHVKKVGILATDDTIQSRLYSRSLERVGLTPISPLMDSALQQQVTRAVYDSEWGIKATGVQVSKQAIRILETASCWLKDQGAEMAIAGCTELSICFASMATVAVPWVDPLDVLADLTLDLAFGHHHLKNFKTSSMVGGGMVRKHCCCVLLNSSTWQN